MKGSVYAVLRPGSEGRREGPGVGGESFSATLVRRSFSLVIENPWHTTNVHFFSLSETCVWHHTACPILITDFSVRKPCTRPPPRLSRRSVGEPGQRPSIPAFFSTSTKSPKTLPHGSLGPYQNCIWTGTLHSVPPLFSRDSPTSTPQQGDTPWVLLSLPGLQHRLKDSLRVLSHLKAWWTSSPYYRICRRCHTDYTPDYQ